MPGPNHGPQFLPVLARLEPRQVDELRRLTARTRIRQAVFLREAVDDLLRKYRIHDLANDVRPAGG